MGGQEINRGGGGAKTKIGGAMSPLPPAGDAPATMDILSYWYFIVGPIFPLVFSYYKMIKVFFCYCVDEACKILFGSYCDDDASSELSYSPDSGIAAKQATVKVKILRRKCNNPAGILYTSPKNTFRNLHFPEKHLVETILFQMHIF